MSDTTTDTTPGTPPQQPDNTTNQKAANEAKKYRLRAKEAEEKLAAALAGIDERDRQHAAQLAAANDHVDVLRLRLAADTIRSMNESRLTADGHSTEPAYVHHRDGEPVRRELLDMVLNSLDAQLGTVLDVSYTTCTPSFHRVQVRSAADLFQRDADGNTTDRLDMQAVRALLRTLGRMDGFKAPPRKPKAAPIPTITPQGTTRNTRKESALAYAMPHALRPYQRDPNMWPHA